MPPQQPTAGPPLPGQPPIPPAYTPPPLHALPNIGTPQTPLQPNYDFILKPPPPPKRTLFAGKSMRNRIVVLLGGVLVLLILFSVVKNLLSSSGVDFAGMTSVAQDQAEMQHLMSEGSSGGQQLSVNSSFFIATGQLVLDTQQVNLNSYLGALKYTISPATLGLKESTATDNELTAAVQANTFAQTYTTIMQTELQTYQRDLLATYNQTQGTHGRSLLKADYQQNQLLLKQINLPAS